MSDVMTPEQRSRCMSRIRGANTSVELRLRLSLWRAGLRYRLGRRLPGRPDLTFVGARVAVFVDGCFWHACPAHGVAPKSNALFWKTKIGGNVERDAQVNRILREDGWTVIRLWEHDVEDDLPRCVRKVVTTVRTSLVKVRRAAPARRVPRRAAVARRR